MGTCCFSKAKNKEQQKQNPQENKNSQQKQNPQQIQNPQERQIEEIQKPQQQTNFSKENWSLAEQLVQEYEKNMIAAIIKPILESDFKQFQKDYQNAIIQKLQNKVNTKQEELQELQKKMIKEIQFINANLDESNRVKSFYYCRKTKLKYWKAIQQLDKSKHALLLDMFKQDGKGQFIGKFYQEIQEIIKQESSSQMMEKHNQQEKADYEQGEVLGQSLQKLEQEMKQKRIFKPYNINEKEIHWLTKKNLLRAVDQIKIEVELQSDEDKTNKLEDIFDLPKIKEKEINESVNPSQITHLSSLGNRTQGVLDKLSALDKMQLSSDSEEEMDKDKKKEVQDQKEENLNKEALKTKITSSYHNFDASNIPRDSFIEQQEIDKLIKRDTVKRDSTTAHIDTNLTWQAKMASQSLLSNKMHNKGKNDNDSSSEQSSENL